jgi:hypothetical protein
MICKTIVAFAFFTDTARITESVHRKKDADIDCLRQQVRHEVHQEENNKTLLLSSL